MKHWFKDRHLRSLLKNSSYLAASKSVAAVAALATLALAGRGLGLAMFGLLVLIHSYAAAASGLSKFQSWQLIVHYGGRILKGEGVEEFRTATGFALALDLISGFGGMVAAMALLPLLGGWFGVPDQYLPLALAYCLLLPTMGAATPVGVLRALDRFDLLSWQGTTYPIARVILVAIAWSASAPFETYLLIWFVTDMGGDLYLWFLAWRELRRRGLAKGIRPTLRPTGLDRPWRFAISVNLTTSLSTAMGPIARLVVGGVLSPAAAGLFRVAGSLANSAQKPADMLAKAFYPEVVRLDLRTKHPWRLMLRGMLLCLPIGLLAVVVVLLAGRPLLDLLFGAEFVPAYPALVVLMFAAVLAVISFPFPSMLLALNRPNDPLIARAAGVIAFLGLVVPLSHSWGLIGAAAAFVIGNAVWIAFMSVQLLRGYARVRNS